MKTENTNPTDNIFSGLKVVDFASFVAGPGAAVILSDFGADVIKVEPPKGELWRIGNKIPPQPQSKYPYMWHLNNRNKRGVAIDLKSPDAAKIVERLARWADVFIVNTPHPAREKLKLNYDHVAQFNPRLIYADITGYGDTGPDAALPGFDLTAYWSRTGLLSLLRDAGAPPTWPFAGTGDAPSGVGLFAAIVTALPVAMTARLLPVVGVRLREQPAQADLLVCREEMIAMPTLHRIGCAVGDADRDVALPCQRAVGIDVHE